MMMTPGCPTSAELEAFAQGELDPDCIETAAEHIDQCPVCEQALRDLSQKGSTGASLPVREASLTPDDARLLADVKRKVAERLTVAPDEQVVLPAIVGFEIEGQAGRGGQATVFRARQTDLGGRLVAIKILGLSPGMVIREQWERFQLEGQALALLDHPNIVKVYQSGQVDRLFYLVLEYIEGGTLRDRLNGRPQPVLEAAKLAETVARAVAYAHQQGVIHRDIKPGNILMTGETGTPKVSDFGLARLVNRDSKLSMADVPIGTCEYMSPEQCLGRSGSIGSATDLYAIGMVLYEMLTGRVPFAVESDQRESRLRVIRQICEDEPVSPRLIRPKVPRDLETICLKCLEKDPARRYRSATHLADDLDRFLTGKAILARPVSAVERVWRWCRRNPVPTVAALLVSGSLFYAAYAQSKYLISERSRLQTELKNEKAETLRATAERDRLRQAAASHLTEARIAVQRGNAKEARVRLLAARELPFADQGEINLELAGISSQMSNKLDAGHYLDQARAALGNDPRVLLAEAEQKAATDPDASRAAARTALESGKLAPADEFFARALTDMNSDAAMRNLKQSLALRPYHVSARRMLVGLEVLCGRLDEASETAKRGRDFAPDDPTDLLVSAIREAVRGRKKEALEVLEKAGDRLDPPTHAGFQSIIKLMSELPRSGNSAVPVLAKGSAIQMIGNISALFNQSRQADGFSLPPGMQQAYGDLARGGLFQLMVDPLVISTRLLSTQRDGFTLYLHAYSLLLKGDFKRAEVDFLEAIKTPSLIDVSRSARYFALRCGFQLWMDRSAPEPERTLRAARLRELIRELLAEPAGEPSVFYFYGQMAWQLGDGPLLLRAAERWREIRPDETGPEIFLAYFAIGKDYPLSALEHASRAYSRRKNGAELFKQENIDPEREVVAIARKALRQLWDQSIKALAQGNAPRQANP